MSEITVPIVQQGRFLFILPVVFVLGGVLAANLVWFLAGTLGLPRAAGGAGAVLTLLTAIGLAIWSQVGPQGSLRIEREALIVDPRWRGERHVSLAQAQVTEIIWRKSIPDVPIGVILEVRGADRTETVGTPDPGLASEWESRDLSETTVPPGSIVDAESFRRLAQVLSSGQGGG